MSTSLRRAAPLLFHNVKYSSATAGHVDFVAKARKVEKIKQDATFCEASLPQGKFVVMHKGKPLLSVDQTIAWKNYDIINSMETTELAFLGLQDDLDPIFAVNVEEGDVAASEEGSAFTDLRTAMITMGDPASVGLLKKAYSALRWRRNTRFCAKCGAPLVMSFSGHQAACPECKAMFYPSPSPTGIALVEAPDHSRVLLIRQPKYPPGMYSCVAGFVDMGESLEECVRREVAEEAGVEVDPAGIEVALSQHWPFPAGSLMVGCFARVADHSLAREPTPCPGEVEDVRWFAPEELRDAFMAVSKDPMLRIRGTDDSGSVKHFVPPNIALAHHLIRSWLLKHGHIELVPSTA